MSDGEQSHNDRIILEGMTFYAYHGATPQEKELGQRFVVDLEVELDLSKPGRSDAIADTVNYSRLYEAVQSVVEGERYNLLEAVAEAIAQRVLARFPVASARVRVEKVSPPIKGAMLKGAAVEVWRGREG